MFKQKQNTETGKPVENGDLSKIKDKEVPEFAQVAEEVEVEVEEEEEDSSGCCFCGC